MAIDKGEGTGYAGGIASAAADGMRCGEAVIEACVEKWGGGLRSARPTGYEADCAA